MMDTRDDKRLEATLARVLGIGTWVACGIIAIGLAQNWLVAAPSGGAAATLGASIVTAGLVVFLLLPCLRVLLMLLVFVRGRDYGFAAVAALVLIIILVALAIGALAPAKASAENFRHEADNCSVSSGRCATLVLRKDRSMG